METKSRSARFVIENLIDLAGGASRVLIAFSGGKDSLVAAHIAASVGVRAAVCEESFVFSQMKEDTRASAAFIGIEVQYREGLDLAWLKRNRDLLFAPLSRQHRFYAARQQRTITRESDAQEARGVVTGRRRDTNTIRAPIYAKAGVWQCHPLYDWRDEDVWGYIEAHSIPIPRIYGTRFGEVEGYAPWIGVEPDKFPEPWKTVADIEPDIVKQAAEYFPEAAKYIP